MKKDSIITGDDISINLLFKAMCALIKKLTFKTIDSTYLPIGRFFDLSGIRRLLLLSCLSY